MSATSPWSGEPTAEPGGAILAGIMAVPTAAVM